MKQQLLKIKKWLVKIANFVSADVFEEACQLLQQNWRHCIEVDLIFLLVSGISGGLIFGLWKLNLSKWILLLVSVIMVVNLSMMVVGKNKNLGGLVRGMTSGHYPLWAREYLFSGVRWLLIKFLLLIPIILSAGLAIFYLIISPSNFWLWLCLLSCFWWESWLILRFNLASIIVSLKNEFSLRKSKQLSWERTKGRAQKLIPWFLFNGLIFAPVIIFLPIIGWFLANTIISFEWLIINQRLYKNKL